MSAYSETLNLNDSLGGQFAIVRQGDTRLTRRIACAAAKAGTIFSNGGGSAVLTLGADHGITEADVVGLFWNGGQRLDLTVSAHDATTITVTVATGIGDVVPAATTVITVGVRVQETDVTVLATNMERLLVGLEKASGAPVATDQGGVNFTDGEDASLLHVAVIAGEAYCWASETGPANPITGTVAKMNCYNGLTVAREIVIGILVA